MRVLAFVAIAALLLVPAPATADHNVCSDSSGDLDFGAVGVGGPDENGPASVCVMEFGVSVDGDDPDCGDPNVVCEGAWFEVILCEGSPENQNDPGACDPLVGHTGVHTYEDDAGRHTCVIILGDPSVIECG
jgi:hypothetical protein